MPEKESIIEAKPVTTSKSLIQITVGITNIFVFRREAKRLRKAIKRALKDQKEILR